MNKLRFASSGRASSHSVWNRNFSLLTASTICGSAGAIAASYGLSFMVFYETGSVFASALVLASRLIPSFLLPLIAGPLLDRLPRKPVLVWGDFSNGVLYLLMGLWLVFFQFSYIGFLGYSIVLACASSLDELAFDSILPMTITKGTEQKSYAAAGMIYPFLNIAMMPLAALLMEWIGIPFLLIIQGILSLAAALIESRMKLSNDKPGVSGSFSFQVWKNDLQQTLSYLHNEPGLMSFFVYAAFTNGIASSCYPVLVAFFGNTPGYSPLMFSMFSVAESLGRLSGNTGQYLKVMKNQNKYRFSVFVMIVYNLMDGILLFISYPFMLANRFLVGALGATTYTLRTAAIQSYIPESMRARINSFQNLLFYGISSVVSLIFGILGDWLAPSAVMLIGGLTGMVVLFLTWIHHGRACRKIFEMEPEPVYSENRTDLSQD